MAIKAKAKTKTKLSDGFKRKWTEALRSGRYVQGGGTMYDSLRASYDALGVAYKVAGVSDEEIEGRTFPSGKSYRFLPLPLAKDNDLIKKITDFSDRGLSFRWIASYIERNL